tara:strand:+ start:487 stop:1491 length:1005 start_codon:yes stop_codon:yes gene_type:complete
MSLINKSDSIFLAGSTGMVGSSIYKLLSKNGYSDEKNNLITTNRENLDLTDTQKVNKFFEDKQPDIVIIAAAKVGGIMANKTYPVKFLLENLKIQNNIIETSWRNGVKRLIFLGSSCIYPKMSLQPIKEKYLLTDSLEPTNQWYAIAKIAGLKLCEAYKTQYNFDTVSLMPTNLYGPGDNYDLEESHVMASLIRKFYEAKLKNDKKVICWGSGTPLREFLFVDDLAEACLHILRNWQPNKYNAPLNNEGNPLNWLNVGSNFEISIKDLAYKIAGIIGYEGEITWDKTKPDGTPRKKIDSNYINKSGWHAKVNIDEGIRKTIVSYINEREKLIKN